MLTGKVSSHCGSQQFPYLAHLLSFWWKWLLIFLPSQPFSKVSDNRKAPAGNELLSEETLLRFLYLLY